MEGYRRKASSPANSFCPEPKHELRSALRMPCPPGRQPESVPRRAGVVQWSREWSRKLTGFATNYSEVHGFGQDLQASRATRAKGDRIRAQGSPRGKHARHNDGLSPGASGDAG